MQKQISHAIIVPLVLAFAFSMGAAAQFRRGPEVAMPQGQPAAKPPTSVIEAGELITGTGQELHNVRILVQNGKITAVGPQVQIPAGAVVYDLSHEAVMPGFTDVHVHLTRHFGPNGRASDPRETPQQFTLGAVNNLWVTLMSGFTTVQSVGNPRDLTLRQYVKQGIVAGPRILTSVQSNFRRSDNDDVLRAKVVMLKYQHADLVGEVFASTSIRGGAKPVFSEHQLKVICDEAKAQGLRSMIHAYGVEVQYSIQAGCGEVEHGTFGTTADLQEMAKDGIWYDPQTGLLDQNYFRFQKQFSGNGQFTTAGYAYMKQQETFNYKYFMEAVHTPGLKVLMGTDAVDGAFGHEEEEIIKRIQLGQSAMDAIDAATSLNATSMDLGNVIGSIKPGYVANIIATNGDPLHDATALRDVSFVMKNGTVYKDTVSAASN